MLPLVLASTSVYREELLARLHLPFITAAPDVAEEALPHELPEELARRLAYAKALAVAKQYPQALIIGSDQVAALGQQRLGKPGNYDNAFRQLHAASGQRLDFHTGICLYNSATGQYQLDVVPYSVFFRPLTDKQIEHYLRLEQPYQCAGSFKSEALGIALFERMEGPDPSALIGLPLIRLISMLALENVFVL